MTANNTQFVLDGVQYTDHAKGGLARGRDDFRASSTSRRATSSLIEDYRLPARHAERPDRRQWHRLSADHVRLHLYDLHGRTTASPSRPRPTPTRSPSATSSIRSTTPPSSATASPIRSSTTAPSSMTGASYSHRPRRHGDRAQPVLPVADFQFTDGGQTYTVNQNAAFDGASYYLITGSATPAVHRWRHHLSASQRYGRHHRGRRPRLSSSTPVRLNADPDPLRGPDAVLRPAIDIAAFDGTHYFAITNSQFTDTVTGKTYTLSGNTAVCRRKQL